MMIDVPDNIVSGNDADKPTSPNVGDIYIATDSGFVYTCYVAGSWVVSSAFTNRTILAGSRAVDTVYQNVSGRLMLVEVSLICTINTAGAGRYANASAKSDANNPPTSVLNYTGIHTLVAAPVISQYCFFSFMVQPNHYYRVTTAVSAGETVAVAGWNETT